MRASQAAASQPHRYRLIAILRLVFGSGVETECVRGSSVYDGECSGEPRNRARVRWNSLRSESAILETYRSYEQRTSTRIDTCWDAGKRWRTAERRGWHASRAACDCLSRLCVGYGSHVSVQEAAVVAGTALLESTLLAVRHSGVVQRTPQVSSEDSAVRCFVESGLRLTGVLGLGYDGACSGEPRDRREYVGTLDRS